jgi:hypothetical protein
MRTEYRQAPGSCQWRGFQDTGESHVNGFIGIEIEALTFFDFDSDPDFDFDLDRS